MKSHSEEMEEQLEPRPERKTVLLIGAHGSALAMVRHLVGRSGDTEPSFKEKETLDGTIIWSQFHHEPTAHEAWVRNRISRGTHYDPADDGPETDADYMAWVAQIVLGVTEATTRQAFDDMWLDAYSCDLGGGFDLLVHGRE